MFKFNFLRAVVVALALFSMLTLLPANAAVVRQAELPELVSISDVIVHAVVSQTYNGADKRFFTGIELEILTLLKGSTGSADTMTLQLPGGQTGALRQGISGMPHLVPGDEVVLLLERTPQGRHIFTGLGQGVFFVLRGDSRTLAIRDLGPLMLVAPNGEHIHGENVVDKVLDLSALLSRIRSLVGAKP